MSQTEPHVCSPPLLRNGIMRADADPGSVYYCPECHQFFIARKVELTQWFTVSKWAARSILRKAGILGDQSLILKRTVQPPTTFKPRIVK